MVCFTINLTVINSDHNVSKAIITQELSFMFDCTAAQHQLIMELTGVLSDGFKCCWFEE